MKTGDFALIYNVYTIAMDVCFLYRGQKFVWDSDKASANEAKHGVRFEVACQVLFDPFLQFVDASVDEERRDAVVGTTKQGSLLFVVHAWREEDVLRIVSARLATAAERRFYEDGE
ncbi:MAG: BrnT family toxin [Acidobacteriota bacterium]